MTEPVTIDAVLNVDQRSAAKEIEQLSRVTPKINLQIDAMGFSDQIQEAAKGTKVKLGFDTSSVEGELRHISNSTSKVKLGIDTGFLKGQIEEASNSTKVKLGVNIGSVKADLTQVFKDAGKSLGTEFQGVLQNTKIDVKGGGILGGLFSAITSPVRAIATGLFEGIGVNISDNLGRGISQGIEKQLSPILGNTELVGQKIGETLATEIVDIANKGLARLNEIPIFQRLQKEFAKDFKDFQKEVLIRSRSDQLRQSKEREQRISEAKTVTTQNLRRELEARPQREKQLQAATRRLQDLSGEDSQKAIKKAQERLNSLPPLIQQAQERLQQVSLGSSEYQKDIESRIKELISQQKILQQQLANALDMGGGIGVKFLEKEIKNRQSTIDNLKALSQTLQPEVPDQEKTAKIVQRLVQRSQRLNKELQQSIADGDIQLSGQLKARIQGINQFLAQYKTFKKKKADAEGGLKDLIPQRKVLGEKLQKAVAEQRKAEAAIISQRLQELSETIKGLEDAQVFKGFIQPRKIKSQSQELDKLRQEYAATQSFITGRQKELRQLNQQVLQLQSLLAVPISAKELQVLGVDIQLLLKAVQLFNIQLKEQQKGQQDLAGFQKNLTETEERIKDTQSAVNDIQSTTGDSFQKVSQLAGVVNRTINVQSRLQEEAQSLLSVDTTANLFNQFQQAERDFRDIIEVINQNANKLKNLRSQLNDPWVEQDGLQGQINELVEFQTKSLALKQKIQSSYLQLGQLPELQRIIVINNELESVEATIKRARQKGTEIDAAQFTNLEESLRILEAETKKREQIVRNIEILQKTPAINFDQAEASQKIVTEQFRLLVTQLNLSKEETAEIIELIRQSQLNSYNSITSAIERAVNVRGRHLPEVYQELKEALEQLKTAYEMQSSGKKITSESELVKLKALENQVKQTEDDLRATEKLIKEYPSAQKKSQESIEQILKLAEIASRQGLRAIQDLTQTQSAIQSPAQTNNQSINIQDKINAYLQSVMKTPEDIEKAVVAVIKNIEQITGTQLSQQPQIIIGKLKEGKSFSGTAINNEAIIFNERIIKDINSFQDNLFVVIHEIFHLFQNDVAQGLETYNERLEAIKASGINIDATPQELNTYLEALGRTVKETSKVSVEKSASYLRESLTAQGFDESQIQKQVGDLRKLYSAMEEGANVFAIRNQDAIAEAIRQQFNLATETVSTAIVPSVQKTGITATVKNGLQHITDTVESQVVALFNNALRSIPNDPNTIDITARQITSLSEIDAGIVKDLALKGSQETAINVLSGITTTFKALEGAEQAVLSLDPTGIAKVVTNVLKPLAVFVAASQVPGANLLAGEATQLVSGALTPFTGALGADVTAALGGAITQMFHNIPLVGGNIEATLIHGTQQLINAAVSGGTEAIATAFTAITGGQLIRGGTEALISKALPEANQQKALQAGKQVEQASTRLIEITAQRLEETADLFQKTTQAISVSRLPASKSVFPSLLPNIDNIRGFLESNLNKKGLTDVYKQLTGASGVKLNRAQLTGVIEEKFKENSKSVQQAIAKIEESGLKANAEIKAIAKPLIDENKIINESKDLVSNTRKALLLYTQLSDIQQQKSLERLYQVQDLLQTQLTVLSRVKQQFNISGKASQSLGGVESQLKAVSGQIIKQIKQTESSIIDIDVANFLPEGISATAEQIEKAQDFIARLSKIVAQLSNVELLPENIPQLNLDRLTKAGTAGYNEFQNSVVLNQKDFNLILDNFFTDDLLRWMNQTGDLLDSVYDRIELISALSHELRHAAQSNFGAVLGLEDKVGRTDFAFQSVDLSSPDGLNLYDGVMASVESYTERVINPDINEIIQEPHQFDPEMWRSAAEDLKRERISAITKIEEDAYQFEKMMYMRILNILKELQFFETNTPHFDYYSKIQTDAVKSAYPELSLPALPDVPNFLPEGINNIKALTQQINQSLQQSNEEIRQVANLSVSEQIYQRDVLKEIAEKLHSQRGIIASSKIKRGEKKPLLAELDRQIQIIESVMSSVNTALRQIDLGDIEGEFRHYEDRIAKIQSIVTNQSPDARLAEINRTIDFLISQLREIQDFGDVYNHAYDRLFQNLNAKYESIDENSAIEKASQEILKLENTFPAMQKFRESIWGSSPASPAIETKPVRETTSPPPLPPLPPIPTPVEEVKKVQEQVKRAIKPESMPFLPLPTSPVEEVKKIQTKIQQAIVPDPWELPLIEEVKKIQTEVKQSVTPKLLLLPAAVDVTEEVKKVQEQVKKAIKPESMPFLPLPTTPVEEVKKVQTKIQQAIVPDPWELPLIEEVKKIQAEVKQSVTPKLLLLPAAVDMTEEVKKVQEQVKKAVTPPPLPPLPPPINVPSNEVKKTQEQVKKTVTADLPSTPKTIASIFDEIQQKIQKEADFLQKSIEKSTALLSSIKNAFPDKPVAIPDVIVSESDRLRDLEFDINQTSLEDREKNILQRIKTLESEIQKRQTQILEPLQAKVIEVQSIEAVYQEILSQIDLYEKAKLALTEKLYRETDLAKRQAIKQSFGRYQSKVLSLKSDLTSLDPQRVSVESFKSQLTEQKTIQEQLQGELLYNQVAVKELQDTIQSVNQQYQRLENSNKTTSETYTLDDDFKQVRQRVRELSDAIQYQQTSSIEKVQRVFSIAQKRKYYLDAMVEELANKLNQLTSQKLLAQSQLSSARFPSTKQTKLNEVNQLESQIKLTQSELDSAVRIQSKVTQSFDQALEELNREIGVQSQLKSELAENQTRLAQIKGKRKAVNQRLQQIDDDLNIYLSQKPFTPTLKETFQRINVQRQGEAITRRVNQRYGVGDGEFPRQGNELRDLATSAIDSVAQKLTGQMSELEKLNILGQSSEQIKVLRGLLSSKVNQFKSSQQEIQVLNPKQVDLQAKINQLITESVTATQQRRQQIAKEVLQLDQLIQNDKDRLNQLKEYVKVGEKAERQLRSLSNIELNINIGTGNIESVRRDLINRVSKGAFSQRALSETAGQEAKIQAKINQLIQKSSQVDDGGKQQIQSTIDKLNEMLDKLRERSVILKDNITIGKQAEIQLKRLAQLETGSGSVSPNQIRASVKELERLQTQLSQPARKGFFESIRELTNHLADRLPPSIKTLFPLFNSLKFAIGGFVAYQVLDPINWWFNLRFGIESLIRTVEKLEASKVKIESFGGSFEEAIKTAERYKVSLDAVVDGYAQLTAATQGTNLEGLKTQKILESVAQSSRVFGLSDEDTKGFLLAMRQILSGSTLQLEELNQISERLPGALALSAKAMRTTTNDLRDMTSAAAVSSEEFAVNFAEQLRLVSQGGLRASLTTIQSERIELLNEFRQLQLTIGDVFGGTIKGGINLLTNLAKGAAIAAKGLSYVLPPLTAVAAVFTAYKLPSIILATSNALKVLFANAKVARVLNALSSGFTSLSAAVKGFIVAQITLSPVLASATFSQRSAAIANISTALATNTNTAAIQGNTVALIANRVALFANNQLLKASIALDVILSSGIANQTKAIIANTIATKGMNAVLFVGAGIAKGLGLAIKGLNLAIAASPLIGLVITAKLATDVFGDLFKEVNRNKEELKAFKAELDNAVNFKSDTFNLKAKVEINKEEFQKELNFFSREINKPFGNLVIGLTSSIIRATSGLVIQPVKSFISLLQGNLRGAFSDLAGIIKLPVKDIQNTFSKDNEGFFTNRAIIAQSDAFLEAEKAATEYYNFLQRIKAGEPVDPEQITQYISSLESYNQQLRAQKGLTEAQITANQVVITQNEQLIKQLQEEKDAIEGTKIRYSEIAKARKAASDSAKKAEVSALHEIEKLTEQGAVKSEEAEIRKQKATLATAELELKAQQEAQKKIKEAIEDRLRYQKRKETGNLAGEIELDPDVLKAIADGNLTRLKELGIDKKFVEDIEKAQTEITELEKKAVLGRIKLARMEKEEKERLAKERQDKSVKDLEDEYKKANDLIERKEQERIIAIKQLRTSGGLSDTEVEKQLESATKQRLSEELKAEEENIKKIKRIRIESGLSEADRKQAIEDKEEKLLEAQKQRNSIVIQILDDQISKEKELKEAIYDNQKSAIDIISSTNSLLSEQLSQLEESINRAKELSQLRFDLGTTQNTADSTRRDIRVTRLERAKEILKQLREDENLGNNERKSLVQELAELGVNSRMTELSLTREINRLEEENRQAKLEASQREFNFKQQQIDLERQSLEITAKKNVLDAANQLNQLKQSRLDQSKTIRDNRGLLKQAQDGLIAATTPQEKVEAEKQLKSAEERLSLSQEQLGIIDQQINNSYEQLEFNKSYITQLKEINQLKQAQLDTERAISLEETKASNTREKFKGISESAQLRDNTQSQQIKKAEKESQAKIDEAKKARDQALATAKTAEERKQALEDYQKSIDQTKEESGNAIAKINQQFNQQRQAQVQAERLQKRPTIPFDINQIYRQLPQLQFAPQGRQDEHLLIKEVQLLRSEISKVKPSINQPLDITVHAQSDPTEIARKVSNAVADRDLILLKQLGLT